MPVELIKASNLSFKSSQIVSFAPAAQAKGIAEMRSSLCSKSAKKESEGGCCKAIADFFKAILDWFCGLCGKKKAAADETKASVGPKVKKYLYQNAEKILQVSLDRSAFENGDLPRGQVRYTVVVEVDGTCILDASWQGNVDTGNDSDYFEKVVRLRGRFLEKIQEDLTKMKIKSTATMKIHTFLVADTMHDGQKFFSQSTAKAGVYKGGSRASSASVETDKTSNQMLTDDVMANIDKLLPVAKYGRRMRDNLHSLITMKL